jgi:hypothetical protein
MQRGAAIINARKLSSAMSAAKAISDHMHDFVCGSSGRVVSMGVPSDGSYGVPSPPPPPPPPPPPTAHAHTHRLLPYTPLPKSLLTPKTLFLAETTRTRAPFHWPLRLSLLDLI